MLKVTNRRRECHFEWPWQIDERNLPFVRRNYEVWERFAHALDKLLRDVTFEVEGRKKDLAARFDRRR